MSSASKVITPSDAVELIKPFFNDAWSNTDAKGGFCNNIYKVSRSVSPRDKDKVSLNQGNDDPISLIVMIREGDVIDILECENMSEGNAIVIRS